MSDSQCAVCPSCGKSKRSAAVNRDGLCNECRGPIRVAVIEINNGGEVMREFRRGFVAGEEDAKNGVDNYPKDARSSSDYWRGYRRGYVATNYYAKST